jgi:hypothetical protein
MHRAGVFDAWLALADSVGADRVVAAQHAGLEFGAAEVMVLAPA